MTILHSTSGVFSATGQSAEVTGRGVSFAMTFGTGTVALEYFDLGLSAWRVARSYTATSTNPPIVIEDLVQRRWRLNCTAYTSAITYELKSGLR